MSMNKYLNDRPSSYMENVPVKISEKYKPPKRITPALSYSQQVSLNNILDSPTPDYNFALEQTVKVKMVELKNARSQVLNDRRERLALVRRRQTLMAAAGASSSSMENPPSSGVSTSENSTCAEHLPEFPVVTETDILTPVPIPIKSLPIVTSSAAVKGMFNLSEFEEDTSSPFDNMELKTLNDLEELAQVLKNDDNNCAVAATTASSNSVSYQPSFPQPLYASPDCYAAYCNSNNISSISMHQQKPLNGFYTSAYNVTTQQPAHAVYHHHNQQQHQLQHNTAYAPSTHQLVEEQLHVNPVPNIIKSLEIELANTRLNATALGSKSTMGVAAVPPVKRDISSIATTSKPEIRLQPPPEVDRLENPYHKLSPRLQQLAKEVSAMGFPLPRVARVCKVIGEDHKKVVDHLLALSELLDLGFKEEKVTKALLKYDNDKDKALDILIA